MTVRSLLRAVKTSCHKHMGIIERENENYWTFPAGWFKGNVKMMKVGAEFQLSNLHFFIKPGLCWAFSCCREIR